MTTTRTLDPMTVDRVRELVAAAVVERDQGMALAADADADRGGWNTQLIDQAIAWMAQTRMPFSANDVRDLLPDDLPVQGLMGARFGHAANNLHLIRRVGRTTSTKKNTHAKDVGLWVGYAEQDAA